MSKRASNVPRIVGEWARVTAPCPRCGGLTEARRSLARQVGLPWAAEPEAVVEWRCVRGLDECTGPTLEETRAAVARLEPDRARALAAGSGAQTWTCRSCGAVWGRALPRCPVDEGEVVPTESVRRSA